MYGWDNWIYKGKENRMLYPTDGLHSAEGLSLPPSKFVYMENKGSHGTRLYWLTVRDSTSDAASGDLQHTLQHRYGSLCLSKDTVLIPATWFSGEISVLHNPFLYGGVMVTSFMRKAQVRNGGYIADEHGDTETRIFDSSKLKHDVWRVETVRPKGMREIVVDGRSDAELESVRELELFERDVRRCMDKRFLPKDLKREYAIMLYLDEKDKAHLYPLLPRELTSEDRLLLAMLNYAVEQQPEGTFSKLQSASGPFPAIYLRAKFANTAWSFEDYRFIE